jgi:hypothetical protein
MGNSEFLSADKGRLSRSAQGTTRINRRENDSACVLCGPAAAGKGFDAVATRVPAFCCALP